MEIDTLEMKKGDKKMSNEVAEVIVAQTRLMEMDLMITVQKMRIKELDARASTLRARSQMERHKLNQMIQTFKGLENEKEEK